MELDEERRAAMVSNLLVVLCGDRATQPVVNTGSLRRRGAALGSFRVPGHPTGMTWDGSHLWYCDFPARALRAVALDSVLNRA